MDPTCVVGPSAWSDQGKASISIRPALIPGSIVTVLPDAPIERGVGIERPVGETASARSCEWSSREIISEPVCRLGTLPAGETSTGLASGSFDIPRASETAGPRSQEASALQLTRMRRIHQQENTRCKQPPTSPRGRPDRLLQLGIRPLEL